MHAEHTFVFVVAVCTDIDSCMLIYRFWHTSGMLLAASLILTCVVVVFVHCCVVLFGSVCSDVFPVGFQLRLVPLVLFLLAVVFLDVSGHSFINMLSL